MITITCRKTRADVKALAIFRKFKEIPGLFLKLFGCKKLYKSKILQNNLDTCLDSFLNGFVKYLEIEPPGYIEAGSEEEYYWIKLFLDY